MHNISDPDMLFYRERLFIILCKALSSITLMRSIKMMEIIVQPSTSATFQSTQVASLGAIRPLPKAGERITIGSGAQKIKSNTASDISRKME